MIGGLAKLTHLNKFGELEKLTIVSLIPRLQNSATTVISIHLERLKVFFLTKVTYCIFVNRTILTLSSRNNFQKYQKWRTRLI